MERALADQPELYHPWGEGAWSIWVLDRYLKPLRVLGLAKFAIVEEAMRKGLVIDCDVLLGKEAYIFEVCRVPEILIVFLILTATLRRVSQSRKITNLHRTNALHSSSSAPDDVTL